VLASVLQLHSQVKEVNILYGSVIWASRSLQIARL